MGKPVQIKVRSKASPRVVFDHLAVAKAWKKWAHVPWSTHVQDGSPEQNGVGAVRRIWPVKEQTVAYQPGKHFGYIMLNRLVPMRNYRSDVYLEPGKKGGTVIRWETQADPLIRLPGAGLLTRIGLRFGAGYLAFALARHSGRCKNACPAYRAD